MKLNPSDIVVFVLVGILATFFVALEVKSLMNDAVRTDSEARLIAGLVGSIIAAILFYLGKGNDDKKDNNK